ncbi:alpha/beta-hydrolase [Suhomyces tanzawaensis NRRL Y-17324]|uniref:Alpha/beta-hydrolase n=1 Tax=Suhomyces tanzawaensis NRRL Y-17324 TaxID=984487 RepID=A0A1E4SLT6_9ASCO|nr:alpha/beta-hydrolase [Suhomyces tanzawaensis NRRL Y-17324]ODV80489.1 alpha/beta-hydrolase [Suhomyces tanzawaensis NRRL Y-17324]
MASNPPGPCCAQANFHEGTPVGTFKTLFGVDTYQTGEANGNDRIIVILTDIFGHKFNNNQLVADQLAKNNYHVLMPDIFNGDPFIEGGDFAAKLKAWLPQHTPEITRPIADKFLADVKKEYSPKFFGSIGHCYGAKYTIVNLGADGILDAGAIAHPSYVTVDDVEAIAKPLIISSSENDYIYPTDLRHKTEEILTKNGVRYESTVYSGVEHGYAVRGDMTKQAVRYAKEKTLADQVCFFSQF